MLRDEREDRYTARGWWADDTLTRWLERHVRERPDAPALAFQNTSLSWEELEKNVLSIAAGLRARGVRRGDVVAIQLPNTLEFIVGYLAIARLGAVTCTLHMPYRGAEVQALMRHSGARLAICLPQSKEMFEGRGVAFGEIEEENGSPLGSDSDEPKPSDPFLLLYTSGTTAAPKGVVHPYRTMLGSGRVGGPEAGRQAQSRRPCPRPPAPLDGRQPPPL